MYPAHSYGQPDMYAPYVRIGELQARLDAETAAHGRTKATNEYLLQMVAQSQSGGSGSEEVVLLKQRLAAVELRIKDLEFEAARKEASKREGCGRKVPSDLLGELEAHSGTVAALAQPVAPDRKLKPLEPAGHVSDKPQAEWMQPVQNAAEEKPRRPEASQFKHYFPPPCPPPHPPPSAPSQIPKPVQTGNLVTPPKTPDIEAPRPLKAPPLGDNVHTEPGDHHRQRLEREPPINRSRPMFDDRPRGRFAPLRRHLPRRPMSPPPMGRRINCDYRDFDLPNPPSFGEPLLPSAGYAGFVEDLYDDQPERPKRSRGESPSSTGEPATKEELELTGGKDGCPRFQPAADEVPSNRRTVIIDDLPEDVGLPAIMEQVQGASIVSTQLVNVKARHTARPTAIIEFLDADAAAAFVKSTEAVPVSICNKAARITLLDTPTARLRPRLGDDIFARGHTRVLMVEDLPPSLHDVPDNLRVQLRLNPHSNETCLQEAPHFLGDDAIRLVFQSVRAAGAVYRKWTASPIFRASTVYFEEEGPLPAALEEKKRGAAESEEHRCRLQQTRLTRQQKPPVHGLGLSVSREDGAQAEESDAGYKGGEESAADDPVQQLVSTDTPIQPREPQLHYDGSSGELEEGETKEAPTGGQPLFQPLREAPLHYGHGSSDEPAESETDDQTDKKDPCIQQPRGIQPHDDNDDDGDDDELEAADVTHETGPQTTTTTAAESLSHPPPSPLRSTSHPATTTTIPLLRPAPPAAEPAIGTPYLPGSADPAHIRSLMGKSRWAC